MNSSRNFEINLSSIYNENEFKKIIEIAKTIEKNNGRLYLVGGCVRDLLLKRKRSRIVVWQLPWKKANFLSFFIRLRRDRALIEPKSLTRL